jgi:four helix bundle protein
MGINDKENPVREKSYVFALRIIKLYKYLIEEKKEYVLSRQVLKSGTSIGANVEEAIGGQSKKDFLAKISIAYKEARETHYWLRILRTPIFLIKKRSVYSN